MEQGCMKQIVQRWNACQGQTSAQPFICVDKSVVKVYYNSSYEVRRRCVQVHSHAAAQTMCRKGV